ncbi:MAG: insulinase family protein [Clostridia bacterium]|nr:insulinase family protein [Clostridia bacterium]MBQ8427566.1 insulinase family protein [Clostridia bacterium]
MIVYKTFPNGLRLVINKMEGMSSVSAGVMVKTGSINENATENGISHFIEHNLFKGTINRSAFEISDSIDRIGAAINAYTSKEVTCYYTKSTKERLNDCLDVLSDIFFNSVFEKGEMDREKGVIIEEINMSEDSPEDVCSDLLAKSYYGEEGLGRTILGPASNIKKFSKNDVESYMDKYYTADNTVISIAGNVDIESTQEIIEKLFAEKFTRIKSAKQVEVMPSIPQHLSKTKKIEQSHISLAMPAVNLLHPLSDALNIANIVFGGSMSSRLFQTIREKLGLAYSVYSYLSQYKNIGTLEFYAGVNTTLRDQAFNAILDEIKNFRNGGVTDSEFTRGIEQMKSSFVFSRESTASQMQLYGRYLLFYNTPYDIEKRLERLNNVTLADVNESIEKYFTLDNFATATVGPKKHALIV